MPGEFVGRPRWAGGIPAGRRRRAAVRPRPYADPAGPGGGAPNTPRAAMPSGRTAVARWRRRRRAPRFDVLDALRRPARLMRRDAPPC
jgi:hypothetical protein